MITGLLAMFVVFILTNQDNIRRNRGRYLIISFFAAVSLFLVFKLADRMTDGKLLLRYKGETEGTYGGYRTKDADVVVSGRLSIFSEDIELWLEHPFTGVGSGSSRYFRDGVSAHTEFSRLIGEHGLPGLIYFILIITTFYATYRKTPDMQIRSLLLALFILAFISTFHAAMRTFVTPVFIILANLNVIQFSLRNKIDMKSHALSKQINYAI
jgi:O-antigen ligase